MRWIGQAAALLATRPIAAAPGPVNRRLAPAVAYPLMASPDGRCLIDQLLRPFFLVGDSAQNLYTSLSLADIQHYLADRQGKGFNTLLAEPIRLDANRVLRSPAGHLPFLRNTDGGSYDGTRGSADFASPNPAFWDHVDAVLDLARSHGFLMLQYVLSWGYGGSWLWQDLINPRNTRATCAAFGSWLGARYRGRDNIVWLDGSDCNGDDVPRAPDQTSGIARAHAVLEGMRAAGATQLRSGDWQADSLSTDQPAFAPFMGVNGIYAYGSRATHFATYIESRLGYRHAPPLPAYLKETGYEAETLVPSDPAALRKYHWWSVLSGATTGLVYGHGDIWPFHPKRWRRALDAPGALDMQRMARLFSAIAWQNLVPSELAGMRRLVTSANGRQDPPSADYVAAARTPDGTLLLAYVPPFAVGPRSLEVDLRGMPAPLRAWWWDPTSGRSTPAGDHAAASIAGFTTPGMNRAGANDWVLIVRA